MRLIFGNIDIPYSHERKEIRRKTQKLKQRSSRTQAPSATDTMTTGDVATILEAHYHVYEIFYETHKSEIVDDIEKSLEGVLESALLGAPLSTSPFAEAQSSIEAKFKHFLSSAEIESYPGAEAAGLPTIASGKTPYRKGGINHRLRHPYSKNNPPRPSLVDTGLYQASATVEIKA